MRILIVEPFCTGSHKVWAEGYANSSLHEVEIISLPGRFWKWRMHGGSITLAKRFHKLDFKPDLILATDMLNVPVFQSLVKPNCPVAVYFHENQFTYPWSPNDKDVELQRDKHYGFINYSSALSADHVYFNSQFHLDSFFTGLKDFLKQFPDYREIQNIENIRGKSSVLHLGLDLKKFNNYTIDKRDHDIPLILWNHRWEYDKGPKEFFKTLELLSNKGAKFQLAVLGKEFNDELPCFSQAREKLIKHIVIFRYAPSFEEYTKWLWKADILPVTSNQDFFGGSIVEAVYCQTIPLLPKRLTYSEIFQIDDNPHLFYEDESDLLEKLTTAVQSNSTLRQGHYQEIVEKYDWSYMVKVYDREFMRLQI